MNNLLVSISKRHSIFILALVAGVIIIALSLQCDSNMYYWSPVKLPISGIANSHSRNFLTGEAKAGQFWAREITV